MDGFCVRLSAEIPQCERPHGPRWQVQVGELWVGAQGDPPFRRAQIHRMPCPPPPPPLLQAICSRSAGWTTAC